MAKIVDETISTSKADFFCELCKLDFTTKEELQEHSWTILHHSKLNKAKGRGCVHECSLCGETFGELLLFTQHLHADTHQDRYQEWKTGQLSSHCQSMEPISADSSFVTSSRSFSSCKPDAQLIPSQAKNCGRERGQNHWNPNSKRAEKRPNSRNRNWNRMRRHLKNDEFPLPFNLFPVNGAGVISNAYGSCEMNQFVTNERDLNCSNFLGTLRSNPSKRGDYTNRRPRSRDSSSGQSNRSHSRSQNHNSMKTTKKARKNQSTSRRKTRWAPIACLDNSSDLSNRNNELLTLNDRPRSTTPTLGVSTRTCSSESVDFLTGKDESHFNDKYASSSRLVPENSSGNHKWNFRNRNLFVWHSDSYRVPRSGKTYPYTSTQESQGKEMNSSEQVKKSSETLKGRGSDHAIVGKGADERGGCPSTETQGHDNGSPEDSSTEVIYNVPFVNQNQGEPNEKDLFVSERHIHPTSAEGNSPESTEMTMDGVANESTTRLISESHSLTQSSRNGSLPKEKKTGSDSKTSTRLRSRSSSDCTASLSRQNFKNLSTKVTQYQPLENRALHEGAALGSTSSDSGFSSKESNPTETSTLRKSEERESTVTKIKMETLNENEKDVKTCTASKITQQSETQGENQINVVAACSFIHIDGMRCAAKTSERYCSYHKRFPQGSLIKSEPQDEHPLAISLDLSTTVTQESYLKEGMSTRSSDAYSSHSNCVRQACGTHDHTKGTEDPNVEMMDLSLSTNYLVLSHSSNDHPLPISSSPSIYPALWNKGVRAREAQCVKPSPWNRTSPNVIHGSSSSASKNSQETFVPPRSPDKGEKTNTGSDCPAPSPEGVATSSGASIPTLDLSRLNLPPNVRRALALKYATKKQVEGVGTVSSVAPNFITSRNRFIESKKEKGNSETPLEQPSIVPYKSPTTPLRIRARQQRSISLDSYPSLVGPVPDSYERSRDPAGTRSPLHFTGSSFSAPLSKQTTYPEKPIMIDLNSAAYLPVVHPPITVVHSKTKDKERPLAESHETAKEGRADRDKLQSSVPSLRTRMRSMSTERIGAYYKVDPPTIKSIQSGALTERPPVYSELDGHHTMRDANSLLVTSALTGMYSQGRREGAPVLTSKPRGTIDFKERVSLCGPESRSSNFTEMSSETRDAKERNATAVALDSHFRQSLNPFETNVELSKLGERGLVELRSSSFDHRRNTAASRENEAPSTRSSHNPIVKESAKATSESTGSGDSGVNFEYSSSKRKAKDFSETGSSNKRRKGKENVSDNKHLSYLPGFEVEELLRLEHVEQSKLKSLQELQEQIKGTHMKIQSLSFELDNLKAKENQISEDIRSTKNKRLEILQFALHRSSSPSDGSSGSSNGSRWSNGYTDSASSVSLYTNASSEGGQNTKTVCTNSLLTSTSLGNTNELGSAESLRKNDSSTENTAMKNANLDANHGGSVPQSELCKNLTDSSNKNDTHNKQMLLQTLGPSVKEKMDVDCESQPRNSQLSSAELARTSQVVPTISASSTSEISDERDDVDGNDAKAIDTFEALQPQTVETDDAGSLPSSSTAARDTGVGSAGADVQQWKGQSENFEKSRKEFLNKIRHQLSTPKKRQQTKKQRKKFSEAHISSSISVSREKILLVREKMKGWKVQQGLIDSSDSNSGGSGDGPTTGTPPDTELAAYEDNSLTPSRIPVRDIDDEPAKQAEPSASTCNKAESKPDKKGIHVVSKKGYLHSSKSHLKIKRKSSHPSKKCARFSSPDTKKSKEQSEHGSDKPRDSSTGEPNLGSESHKADVESLKQKLQGNNEGSKSVSTSKAKASSFEGHTGAVCSLKVYQGRLYTTSADKTTKAFDIQTGKCVQEYQGHHHAVNCLEISKDGTRLFTGSNDQTVRSYNIKTRVCTHKFTFDGRVMCLHIGFGLLYVGLSTGVVTVVDLTSNTCVERFQCHEPRGVSCLATASEGQRSLLCTGSFDATISIRDYKSGLLIKTLKSHTMTVLCMQVVENVLYTGAADCNVLAHNLNTGELVRSYDGHTLSVSSLQVVGRVLITSSLDKLIRCYDLMSAELLQVYGGQTDMVFSVHVSNGRIYSGSRDGKVMSVKLDLRVYHPCKWKDCQYNFGVSSHMKDHLRENHVIQPGTIDKCMWADCGQVFAESEGIDTIMDHVLGHVEVKRGSK